MAQTQVLRRAGEIAASSEDYVDRTTRNNTDAESLAPGNVHARSSRARACHRSTVRTVKTGNVPSRMT
jgi:hypothetical protein